MRIENEPPHAEHQTGWRWLDLTLALSAMFISVVSLGVAIHHGLSMQRLVQANSWPYLMSATENLDAEGRPVISVKVENAGVGPSRLETFEVWWQDQPVTSADDLVTRCCIPDAKGPMDAATARSLRLSFDVMAPSVMRAGSTRTLVKLEETEANAAIWQRLDVARLNIRMRACYCSVFDECWLTDLVHTDTTTVPSCPAVKVPFTVPARWFQAPAQPSTPSR